MVYGVALNEKSPCRDIYALKYKFSVPEFWRLKLSLEAQSTIYQAMMLDDKIERDSNQVRR